MEDKLAIEVTVNGRGLHTSFKYIPDVSHVKVSFVSTIDQKFYWYKKAIEENDEVFKNLRLSTFNAFGSFGEKQGEYGQVNITWYLNNTKMEIETIIFDITKTEAKSAIIDSWSVPINY